MKGWHWREYADEFAEVALLLFLSLSAVGLAGYVTGPPFVQRLAIGVMVGATVVVLIYSPMGLRSGAHMNPCVTLGFWRMGKVANRDVLGYIAAQFAGGLLGVGLFAALFPAPAKAERYIATVPGPSGMVLAFLAELFLAFTLKLTLLRFAVSPRKQFTGVVAGLLVMLFITLEAPISGMSINPARSFASNVFSGDIAVLWIYFVAPLLGMLSATEVFQRRSEEIPCAKWRHHPNVPCIHCGQGLGENS